jgi:hypothetical protein
VAARSDGSVVVVGHFTGTRTFGSTSLTSSGGTDIVVLSLNPGGSVQWAKSFGSAGNDHANSVVTRADASVVVVGSFTGSMDVGGTRLTSSPGNSDIVVFSLSASSDVTWATSYGGPSNDVASGMATRTDGSSVVLSRGSGSATSFEGTIFDPAGAMVNATLSGGDNVPPSPTAEPSASPAPAPQPVNCVMTAWVGDAAACSKSCGGGALSQVRSITQLALHGGTACGSIARTRGCNNMACPTFTFKVTRWYKCNQPCGGGQQRRQVSCLRSDGKSAVLTDCGGGKNGAPDATRPCNTHVCATYIWQTSAWSKCAGNDGSSKSCTGDDGISGKATRTKVCIDSTSKVTVAGDKCPSAVFATERVCNTRKCTTYGWDIGAFDTCSKTCGGGVMTRSVNCKGSDGKAAAASKCKMSTPKTSSKCNTASCDKCAMVRTDSKTCSGHGTCASATGACTCGGGYTGMQCDTPPGCSGVLDKHDRCCLGTLNPDGTCCKSTSTTIIAAISAEGGCCRSGQLDVCGVCDGTATAVDAIGTCCSPPGVIGEDSLCCPSGTFDTCGVCEGDDSSCNVAGAVVVAAPIGQTAVETVGDATKLSTFKDGFKASLVTALGVPADAVSIGTVTVKAARHRLLVGARRLAADTLDASFNLEQAKVAAAGSAVSAVEVTSKLSDAVAEGSADFAGATVSDAQPAAVCGNGACERGERCTDAGCTTGCMGDCPYQVKLCPTAWWPNSGECSSRGKCIGASGACVCFTKQGYVGAACDECAEGYVMRYLTNECVRVLSAADKAADTTPAPTPMRSGVKVSVMVTGYTPATFTAAVLSAYRTAWAAKTGANLGDVDVRNVASAHRLAVSSSVTFDVFVSLKDPSAAAAYELQVKNMGDAELAQGFSEALAAISEPVPATLVTINSAPTTVQLTSAPTPAPPPAVEPRAAYEPSATAKTLHAYMKATGRIDEEYDPLKTTEAAASVGAVGVVSGVVLLLLFLLFVFLQKGCKRCKCCYHAHLSEKHHCRAKVILMLAFVAFCGLLCGSVKGRNSFHKAADILAPALSKTSALFNEMEVGAVRMVASSAQFDAGYNTLTACSPTKCSSCPWPGDESKNGKEADWDKAARQLLIGSDGNGGAAATMAPQIATYKEQGRTLLAMLKGQGAHMQKISDSMAKDGKKYIDAFIGITLAFGFFIALLGTVGVWCLSAKPAKGSCHFSSLSMLLAQILGVLFVVLLTVLVAVQASASAALGEVCYQPVPETALVHTLAQPGTYNVLKPEAFDLPTLTYYMTCNGTNALGVKLGSAIDQITGLDPELRRVQECDTLALRKVIPAASAAMANVQYALDCPRVNDLLLTFTRDAVCTHMVDGLFFLWTVQAACGGFLLFTLVIMRLVMQAFHAEPPSVLQLEPMPKVGTGGWDIDMRNPMHEQGMVTLTVTEEPPPTAPELRSAEDRHDAWQGDGNSIPAGDEPGDDTSHPADDVPLPASVIAAGAAPAAEAAALAPPPSLVPMEGRLEKKGVRRMQQWKHCRFSLDRASGLLSCFDDEPNGADAAVSQYHIVGARAVANRKGKRQHRFDFVQAGGAPICCAASSAAEKVAWLEAASSTNPPSVVPGAEHAALPGLTVTDIATQSYASAVC